LLLFIFKEIDKKFIFIKNTLWLQRKIPKTNRKKQNEKKRKPNKKKRKIFFFQQIILATVYQKWISTTFCGVFTSKLSIFSPTDK
jgi:hypothetical protein